MYSVIMCRSAVMFSPPASCWWSWILSLLICRFCPLLNAALDTDQEFNHQIPSFIILSFYWRACPRREVCSLVSSSHSSSARIIATVTFLTACWVFAEVQKTDLRPWVSYGVWGREDGWALRLFDVTPFHSPSLSYFIMGIASIYECSRICHPQACVW